jgi:hypothetical protein
LDNDDRGTPNETDHGNKLDEGTHFKACSGSIAGPKLFGDKFEGQQPASLQISHPFVGVDGVSQRIKRRRCLCKGE